MDKTGMFAVPDDHTDDGTSLLSDVVSEVQSEPPLTTDNDPFWLFGAENANDPFNAFDWHQETSSGGHKSGMPEAFKDVSSIHATYQPRAQAAPKLTDTCLSKRPQGVERPLSEPPGNPSPIFTRQGHNLGAPVTTRTSSMMRRKTSRKMSGAPAAGWHYRHRYDTRGSMSNIGSKAQKGPTSEPRPAKRRQMRPTNAFPLDWDPETQSLSPKLAPELSGYFEKLEGGAKGLYCSDEGTVGKYLNDESSAGVCEHPTMERLNSLAQAIQDLHARVERLNEASDRSNRRLSALMQEFKSVCHRT